MRSCMSGSGRKGRAGRTGNHGLAVLAIVVLSALQSIAGSAVAEARDVSRPDLLAGFDVENPQWMTSAQQKAVLAELKSAGVTVIRFPLAPSSGQDFSSIIAFTEQAFAAGISSEVIVSLMFRPGAQARPAVPGTLAAWPQPGLSSLDPKLTERGYKPVFDRFDRDGIKLAGIEVGNEINWPQFNGDFPVPGTGHTLSLHDLAANPLGKTVATGFRAYVSVLAVVKQLRDASRVNSTTPIILAGLADISPNSPPPAEKIDDIDIATTIDFMRANGADDLVDAYGIHTYVADGISANTAAARLRVHDYLARYDLSRCGLMSEGKPCWITEWGTTQPMASCPFDDQPTRRKLLTFLSVIKPYVGNGRLAALFYADWDDPHLRGLFRCGKLSASGTLYLHYFDRMRK